MPKPTHAQIEYLLKKVVLPFYHIKRDTPIPLGERRMENDACSLAPEIDPNLDIGKICQFATVHDVVEIYAEDTSVFASEAEQASKAEREKKALEVIIQEFGHFTWIINTIEAYERKDTDEARFVYAVDKYITVAYDHIDNGSFFRERKMTREDYGKKLEAHRIKAQSHPAIGKYYDEVRALLDTRPNYFHQN